MTAALFKSRVIPRCDLRPFAYREGDHTLPVRLPLRVTDAREPTAAQAVEKVLQVCWNSHYSKPELDRLSHAAGMTATVSDGRVRVRKRRAKCSEITDQP